MGVKGDLDRMGWGGVGWEGFRLHCRIETGRKKTLSINFSGFLRTPHHQSKEQTELRQNVGTTDKKPPRGTS